MTIPTIQTLTGKLNWFKAHLPELRVVLDSTNGQHYVFSNRGDGGTKGTGNGVPKDEYKSLRKKTPSNDIRKMVNPDGPKVDPVYGYQVDKFEADHILSMKEITENGFSRLTREQQIEILNLRDNFVGLGKSSNASKGSHSWVVWKEHSKMGEVPVNIRMEMLENEKQARESLKIAIEERLKK
ncbi:transposase [Virgibacillus halodenitrificans]|uniref:transposase n=1 Tax=Virgibacillus halodenitrificans TaxID=1482 RepID=UPI000EF5094E|nr:transposase [Virgibacillus halodenitrificans]